jgi:hypothetical protein
VYRNGRILFCILFRVALLLDLGVLCFCFGSCVSGLRAMVRCLSDARSHFAFYRRCAALVVDFRWPSPFSFLS